MKKIIKTELANNPTKNSYNNSHNILGPTAFAHWQYLLHNQLKYSNTAFHILTRSILP